MLFALIVFLGFPIYLIASFVLMDFAEKSFGVWGRIAVGIFALVGFFMIFMRYLYRFGGWLSERGREEKRDKYRAIYRVKILPTDPKSICKSKDTEIKIGDYGWEATPWRNNGLIYLHGLNEKWGLVWIAGFRPEQIEYVCPKPVSQYDWRDFEYDGPKPRAPYHWQYSNPKSLCPFPVETPKRLVRLTYPVW